jgi:hypothetical protein
LPTLSSLDARVYLVPEGQHDSSQAPFPIFYFLDLSAVFLRPEGPGPKGQDNLAQGSLWVKFLNPNGPEEAVPYGED